MFRLVSPVAAPIGRRSRLDKVVWSKWPARDGGSVVLRHVRVTPCLNRLPVASVFVCDVLTDDRVSTVAGSRHHSSDRSSDKLSYRLL